MKYLTLSLAAVIAVLSTSCGSLPERQKHKGPQSTESTLPWNRRLPGEGQGGFGGLAR
jgi:hypothetical protein